MGSTIIQFTALQAANALWNYREDSLVDRALALGEAELARLGQIAGSHWRQDHDLPLRSRLVVDKVIAFACIEYFEGRIRPLAQERRRPERGRPARLR